MAPKGKQEVATHSRNLLEFTQWLAAVRLEADIETDEAFDPATILENILAAKSFEEAVELQNSSLLSGKNLTNQIHTIYDFTLRKSDEKFSVNKRTIGVYAIVQAAWEDGTEFSYGVGASNVLAILWQARNFGKLPGKFQLTGRETDNGTLLSLVPVKTAVAG
jgi:hypothetical protein